MMNGGGSDDLSPEKNGLSCLLTSIVLFLAFILLVYWIAKPFFN
jgi:hypothetical protein